MYGKICVVLSSPFNVVCPLTSECPFVCVSFSDEYVSSLILLRFRGCCRKPSESWRRRRRGLRIDALGLVDDAVSGENMTVDGALRVVRRWWVWCAIEVVVDLLMELLCLLAFLAGIGVDVCWRRSEEETLNSML
jgi:hypothetical protein